MPLDFLNTFTISGGGGDSGDGPTAGTGGLSITSTTFGTSPMAAELRAVPSGSLAVSNSFQRVTYVWVVSGQPLSDYGVANLPTQWKNPSIKYGQRVYFYFDQPDTTYSIYCWARLDDGTAIGLSSVEVTTGNANTTYSGTNTICWDPSGTFSGKPTGAQECTTMAQVTTALNAATSAKRLLFARGQTFTNVVITEKDHLKYMGAFGSGARPIVRPNTSGSAIFSPNGASVGSPSSLDHFILDSIDFRGYWDAATETGMAGDFVHAIHTSCTFALMHNCNVQGFKVVHMHLSDVNAFRLLFARTSITNWQDYGFYTAENGNAYYSLAEMDISQPTNAPTGSNQGRHYLNNMQGGIRMGGAYAGLNLSQFSVQSRGSWSPAEQAAMRLNSVPTEDAEQILDRVTAESGGAVIWNTGANSGYQEKRLRGVWDKVLIVSTAKTGYDVVLAHCGGVDYRNILVVTPNVSDPDNAPVVRGFSLTPDGAPDTNNLNAPVRFLGCTRLDLRNSTNDLGDVPALHHSGGGSFTNFTSNHNVEHGPSLDTPVDGGLTTASNILGFVSRWGGVRPNFPLITGTFGSSVAHNGTFTISYPSGTNKAYWDGLSAENHKHAIRVNNGAIYYADATFGAGMEVAYLGSSIRITNRSGVTWSAGQAYQIRLDRHTEMTTVAGTVSPSAIPLYLPPSAFDDSGLVPYDDFFGTPRPGVNETQEDHLGNTLATSGNEAGAMLAPGGS